MSEFLTNLEELISALEIPADTLGICFATVDGAAWLSNALHLL